MKKLLIIILSCYCINNGIAQAPPSTTSTPLTTTTAPTSEKSTTSTPNTNPKPNPAQQPITKIIVIRHAEKSNDGTQDPPLSPEGINRAERLATYFKDTKIDLLFATPYKRTSQTLSALAAIQHLNITTYNPSDNSFFDLFLQNQAGKTAVIAGHSNTAPMIVNGFLKNNKYPQLPESEFGRMWVLTFKGNQLLNCEVVAY